MLKRKLELIGKSILECLGFFRKPLPTYVEPHRLKIFFDMEFTGLHQNTSIISLGMVAETGETFYAEFTDYDKTQINDWLREHVIDNLVLPNPSGKYENGGHALKDDRLTITNFLHAWLQTLSSEENSIEIWGDCLGYDWVLFCELWGGVMNLPKNIYYIPFDICTLMKIQGIDPDISREKFTGGVHGDKHNALFDAEIIMKCYEKLWQNK